MTSHRPYRAGIPEQRALSILKEESGYQLDLALTGAFVQLGQQGKLSATMGYSGNGIPLRSCPMCGSTLAIRREHRTGEKVYCRNCSSEFELNLDDESRLQATPTGKTGNPKDLEPETNTALIARTVREIVEALPLSELLNQSNRQAHGNVLP